MKNKVIALSLLITALSIVPAFAATTSNCNSTDLNNSNSNRYILKKGVSISDVNNYLSDKCKVDVSKIINNCTSKNQNTNKQKNDIKNSSNAKKSCTSDQNTSKQDVTTTSKPASTSKTETTATSKPASTSKTETTTTSKPASTSKTETTATSKPASTSKTETTTTSKTETTATTTNTSVSSYEKQVVDLVNVERAKNGLSALTLDTSVSNVARTKSQDMATNNYFDHNSPTYGRAGAMLSQFGIKYTAWGENIAYGQKTPEEVVTAWMNSEGHRANILASDFTKIGVGYATNSNGRAYWTQMFIRN